MAALFQVLTNDVRNVHGFVLLVLGGVHLHLVALAVVGPQGLALALRVVLDDAVGGVEDVGGGAVVLFQPDGLCTRVELFKTKDIFNSRSSKTIDALVIVAHHANVPVRAGEQAHQTELRHTGVLILVHQQIFIFILVKLPHIRMLCQKLYCAINQIVKIKSSCFSKLSLIRCINLRYFLFFIVTSRIFNCFSRTIKPILPASNLI